MTWLVLLLLAAPVRGERREDLPKFNHRLERIDKLRWSIKLPKGFAGPSAGDDVIVNGNAAKDLWLWGRVTRGEGRWLEEQIERMQLGARCGGQSRTALRTRVKTKFLLGAAVSCAATRSHALIDEAFAVGWIRVWANSRKTNSHYIWDLQTTEAAHEGHVQEMIEKILWSLEEPKELWLDQPKKKKRSWRIPWPKRDKHRRSGEKFEGDDTIFIK